jgi:hypothetical protein
MALTLMPFIPSKSLMTDPIHHFDIVNIGDQSNIDHFDVEIEVEQAPIVIQEAPTLITADIEYTPPVKISPVYATIIQAFVIESIGPPGEPGPPGIPGPPGQGFEVKGELPGGAIDGVNKTFTTMLDFMDNSLAVFLNGLRQAQTNDYTVPGPNSFHMNDSPLPNDTLVVDYLVQD